MSVTRSPSLNTFVLVTTRKMFNNTDHNKSEIQKAAKATLNQHWTNTFSCKNCLTECREYYAECHGANKVYQIISKPLNRKEIQIHKSRANLKNQQNSISVSIFYFTVVDTCTRP